MQTGNVGREQAVWNASRFSELESPTNYVVFALIFAVLDPTTVSLVCPGIIES